MLTGPPATGIVRLLLEAGADPTEENLDGETALSMAQGDGYGDVVALLESWRPTGLIPDWMPARQDSGSASSEPLWRRSRALWEELARRSREFAARGGAQAPPGAPGGI